jgi:hypothetical protein
MRALHIMLLTGMCIGLSATSLFAKQVSSPPKYDEAVMKKDFDAFMESVDMLTVSKDYPKAVRKLLSGDPEKQIQAVRTLAATGEIEVIPWLLPFLEAENKNLRIWTGSSLEKLVSSHVLNRRDINMPDFVLIKSLRPGDRDLRPLAWVVLKMFRKPDDGNTHAYAASMTMYLGLHEFERELQQCLESSHPAVSDKAKWALESLERQKEYEKATSNKLDAGRSSAETIDFRLRIRDKSSNEKVITRANLIRIKQFILKQGLRETYCNMYNNNPAFRTKSFSFYLNPDTGQENINCDTDKSDFHTLTIRKSGGGKNQYRTVQFLDEHYVYIVVSWPTKDLTVSQAREFVIEAIKDILKEMEKEKPDKKEEGDGE